jgi:FKBP-type peptidyl-prolyl cis-trans isomerase FklB
MGVAIGNSLKQAGFDQFNDKVFYQAITEVLGGKETVIKADATNNIIQSYMMKMQGQKASKNLTIGKKFLEENKKDTSVKTLASGLQYKILKQGQGDSPTINDKVTCHYHGTLINGKVFDSSVQRGQPAQFAVNGVISGWTEALQLMKPGAKWKLFIPAELAYGEQNIPGIEPNSVLIFEVELISVEKTNK